MLSNLSNGLAALICLSAFHEVSGSPKVFNLTYFETELLPQWVARFKSGPSPGDFSWLPTPVRKQSQGTSIYGTTDLAYTLHFVGQLDGLSAEVKAEWAATINSFQNASTGFYEVQSWENQNKDDWPWHPSHAAVETLALLGHSPKYPMTDVISILRNRSAWEPWMEKYIGNNKDVWGGSQQAQSLPGIARSADPSESFEFYHWYFDWLNNHSNASTGYWSGQTQSLIKQLGGAFHLYHVYSCFGEKWPYPEKVVDTTLKIQNKKTGKWSNGLSYCIDLDGVYSLVRSAILAETGASGPYRWDDVKGACIRYLDTVTAQLSNEDNVLGNKSIWAVASHHMHGALGAVATCASAFPDLVHTVRPWHLARNRSLFRSCAYASSALRSILV